MRVLFVHSGNSQRFPVSPFLRSQAESLRAAGVDVDFFPVVGKGWAYLRNVAPLRAAIKERRPDVVHAHYSLCGCVAVLARGGRPVVLSLMGDDAQGTFSAQGRRTLGSWFFVLLAVMVQPFLHAIVYKSKDLGKVVWRKRIAHWLPNGVRLDQFRTDAGDAREELGFDRSKKHVLFLGDPEDPNKNIALVRDAIALLDRKDLVFHAVHGIDHDTVVKYLNSVDVFTLCSFGEGSPNVIKEAMAMDRPIVTVPAGDAPWVLGDTTGCYVAGYDAEDFAEKLERALAFNGRTKGRERLVALGLDAATIAGKLVAIYRGAINR
jgi:teichuronic acid biosynthesis glycosyltransferase TuaC